MCFDYIWAVIELNGTPPTGRKLHQHQSDYKFYPFAHAEGILTIDFSLWEFTKGEDESSNVAIIHFPEADTISMFLDEDVAPTKWRLVAFSDSAVASTIDPENSMPLSKISPTAIKQFTANFTMIGFDVIDLSGLSALTNVGFTASDLTSLSGTEIVINQYGLIATANDGRKYGEFASLAAVEHAPFFPVEIWTRNKPA